jgi:hypothetical protein
MAQPQTRTSVVFLDGLKITFAKSNNFDINTNSQPQVGVDGYVGHSTGAILTKLEFDEIIPVSKLQSNAIKKYLLARKSCTVTYLAGGQSYMFDGVIIQATITGESMNGTLMGKFTIEGGEPRVFGLTIA